jgi:hypothetical protein
MNIESKLRLLRKAKKRRVALPFHTRDVGGIDVNDEDFPSLINFIKALFKVLKSAKFDIEINHWGEIFLIEPNRKIEISLSVRKPINKAKITEITQRLKKEVFFQQENRYENKELEVTFKANRQGTKSRTISLPSNDSLYKETAKSLLANIIDSVAGLVDKGRAEYRYPRLAITSEDILCVMNYGSVLNGSNSQFFHLIKNERIGIMPKLRVNGDYLMIGEKFGQDIEILLNPQSKKLLARFFTFINHSEIEKDEI